MTWYSIDIPQTSLDDGAYHRLCRQFQKAFIGAGAPADFALFAQRRAVPARRLYLSPPSGVHVPDLIRHYKGRPCSAPEPSSVTLIYGVPGASSLLNGLSGSHETSKRRPETPIYPLSRSQEAASAG